MAWRSTAGAAFEHSGDFVAVETEDLVEHLVRVLSETRRGKARAVVIAADPELVSFVRHLAHLGMFEAPEELAVRELRIVHVVAGALYHPGGNAFGLEQLHQGPGFV